MKPKIDLFDVKHLLQWIDDIETGEGIWSRDYKPEYFGFDKVISCNTLNALVDHVNPILKELGYKTRITWGAGEIRPTTNPERVKIIDS